MNSEKVDIAKTTKNVAKFLKNEYPRILVLSKAQSAPKRKLAAEKVRIIELIVNRLPMDERKVIYFSYFKRIDWRSAIVALGISSSQFYELRDSSLQKFANLYPYEDLKVYKVKSHG
ncbi:hypothetical protein [Liquorilactobacillus hordei]|uniref:hypothetical protein n=1 Tax=Liquorilactobacillus hordei TaxID=468911 RepID=UPI001CBF2DAF|nr:hypothetical protein [Liquorilactobacillus hordei]MBZ2406131.1 hypothetical protein [Liquorilactobacillus hordei]